MKKSRKTIVVTGGAGQLGSAICKSLDKDNFVFMADLRGRTDKIKELKLKNTYPLNLDVTSELSINMAFDKVIKKFGKVDVLINNAGVMVPTPFEKRTFEEFDEVMKVNAYGTFFCCKEALKHMAKQDSGCIINIGSIYGVISPDPRIYGESGRNSPEVYGMSKAAVIQLTKYLAVHIKSKNIRINCVSPGGIFNNQTNDFVENYKNKTPVGRMANEDEIAKFIRFLCSDDVPYLTGQNIVIDGGFTIW